MDKLAICKKIKDVTKRIVVLSGETFVGSGTGVIINDKGVAITANHVINPLKKIKDPNLFIIAKDEKDQIAHFKYDVVFCDVSFTSDLPQYLGPINIDLAILKPSQPLGFKCEYVELEDKEAEEGEEVIMAGFPDEIKLPFDVSEKFNFNNPELGTKKAELENVLAANMALMMMKSGMIGATFNIKLNGKFSSKDVKIDGAEYWVDNASTYGASGGPAINSEGKLIGIVCEKAMTKFRPYNAQIPSGSSRVLSHKLITWVLKMTELGL